GTVTESHPFWGMASIPLNRSGLQPAGARPEAFRPCRPSGALTIAKASLPIPQPVGSTTVSAMAAATAASTALPPACNIASPACGAKGCEVLTILRPRTAERAEAKGLFQFIVISKKPSCPSVGPWSVHKIGGRFPPPPVLLNGDIAVFYDFLPPRTVGLNQFR